MEFFELQNFDETFHSAGRLCGIDEAGRGPLAGPVVAACVILKSGCVISGLDDSKKLTEKKREFLFDKIIENAVSYGIGKASPTEIDEINILQATFLAMQRACENAKIMKSDFALVDGNRLPKTLICPAESVVKGDGKSACIAAASVLAKVTRDREMKAMAEVYPAYDFDKHKGYPTKAHYEKIKAFGILPIHRKTFLKNLSEK